MRNYILNLWWNFIHFMNCIHFVEKKYSICEVSNSVAINIYNTDQYNTKMWDQRKFLLALEVLINVIYDW